MRWGCYSQMQQRAEHRKISEDHGDLIELNQEFAEKVDLLFSMKSKEKCLGYIDK